MPHTALPASPRPARTRALRPLLALLALASSIYAFRSLPALERLTSNFASLPYGGYSRFLTINGLVLSTAAFLLSLLSCLLPAVSRLHRTLLELALPVQLLITALYWALRFYDPSLLIPPGLSRARDAAGRRAPVQVPLRIDLALHFLPALALAVEWFGCDRHRRRLLDKRARRKDRRIAASLCCALAVVYAAWSEHCARINKLHAYPFLDLLSPAQRALVYAAATSALLITSHSLHSLAVVETAAVRAPTDHPRPPRSEKPSSF